MQTIDANFHPTDEKLPILVIENPVAPSRSLSLLLHTAGFRNPLVILPNAARAVRYLEKIARSSRGYHPLPGLALWDVTLPVPKNSFAASWLSQPASRQLVITDLRGSEAHQHFKSAVAFGPNAITCKFASDDLAVTAFRKLRHALEANEALTAFGATLCAA